MNKKHILINNNNGDIMINSFIIVIIFIFIVLFLNIKLYIVKSDNVIKGYINVFYFININLNYNKLKTRFNFKDNRNFKDNIKYFHMLKKIKITNLKIIRRYNTIDTLEVFILSNINNIIDVKNYNVYYIKDNKEGIDGCLECSFKIFNLLIKRR